MVNAIYITFIVILIVLIFASSIGGFAYRRDLSICESSENGYCLTYACSNETNPCGLSAFRCEDGTVMCSGRKSFFQTCPNPGPPPT